MRLVRKTFIFHSFFTSRYKYLPLQIPPVLEGERTSTALNADDARWPTGITAETIGYREKYKTRNEALYAEV